LEVDTLAELRRVREALATAGALVGESDHGTTKSLYAKDPDGLEFEVVWLIPAALLDERAIESRTRIGRLDLDGEIARYGADTRGGVGISVSRRKAGARNRAPAFLREDAVSGRNRGCDATWRTQPSTCWAQSTVSASW
jgi:hypothetical protein